MAVSILLLQNETISQTILKITIFQYREYFPCLDSHGQKPPPALAKTYDPGRSTIHDKRPGSKTGQLVFALYT
jgi:hypothetical protein